MKFKRKEIEEKFYEFWIKEKFNITATKDAHDYSLHSFYIGFKAGSKAKEKEIRKLIQNLQKEINENCNLDKPKIKDWDEFECAKREFIIDILQNLISKNSEGEK